MYVYIDLFSKGTVKEKRQMDRIESIEKTEKGKKFSVENIYKKLVC